MFLLLRRNTRQNISIAFSHDNKRCKRHDPKSLDKWHRDLNPQSSAWSSHLPSPSLLQKNVTKKTSGNISGSFKRIHEDWRKISKSYIVITLVCNLWYYCILTSYWRSLIFLSQSSLCTPWPLVLVLESNSDWRWKEICFSSIGAKYNLY